MGAVHENLGLDDGHQSSVLGDGGVASKSVGAVAIDEDGGIEVQDAAAAIGLEEDEDDDDDEDEGMETDDDVSDFSDE